MNSDPFHRDLRPGYRPANGTEGDLHRSTTCDYCTIDHDGGWHEPDNAGESCPIIMDAMFGDHSYPNPQGPPQWESRWVEREWSDGSTGNVIESRCTEWVGPCSCATDERKVTLAAYHARFEEADHEQ